MGFRQQKTRTLNRIMGLDPQCIPLALAVVGWGHLQRLDLLVTWGRRTILEQNGLYAQGRTSPGDIVTRARGGESYHNYGLAFDFVCMDAHGIPLWGDTPWTKIGEFGESIGLQWGGRWTGKKRDRPHLECSPVHWSVLKSVADGNGFLPPDWMGVRQA